MKAPCFTYYDLSNQVLRIAVSPYLQDSAIFMVPCGQVPFKRPVLWWTTLQWLPASILEQSPGFPGACAPWNIFITHLLGWYARMNEPGFGFIPAAPGIPMRSSFRANQYWWWRHGMQGDQILLWKFFEWSITAPQSYCWVPLHLRNL